MTRLATRRPAVAVAPRGSPHRGGVALAMPDDDRLKTGVSGTTIAVIVTVAVLLVGGLAAAIAFGGSSGGTTNGGGGQNGNNGGNVPPADKPVDPKDFDLEKNWGKVPMEWRKQFARAEIAAGIRGLARFLAVWAWGAFRAGKPILPAGEVAAIAANKDWCRTCHNTDASEKAASKAGLDRVTKPKSEGGDYDKPWPPVADYAGWTDGSYGLFDILAGSHAHDGIHNDSFTPLISRPATVLFDIGVQLYIAGWMVYRIVHRADLPVLVKGDSKRTWANIRACTATPSGFIAWKAGKNSPDSNAAQSAFQNCLARADEIGIDLSLLPLPFDTSLIPPWNWPGASVYWQRLGVLGNVPNNQNDNQNQNNGLLNVGAGLLAKVRSAVAVGATAPLIIALHGRAADENQLLGVVDATLPIRTAFIRGAIKSGDTYRYYDPMHNAPIPVLVTAIKKSSADVEAAIKQLRATLPTSEVYVLGYSQGGSIAYDLAARGVVDGVIIGAGYLPAPLRPQADTPTRLRATHGQKDATVPYADGEAAYNSFTKYTDASFQPLANGTHALSTLSSMLKSQVTEQMKGEGP